MNSYKRWFELQSDNYMKSLNKIEELEKENNILKEIITDIGRELSDEELEGVMGGMSIETFRDYVADLMNEHGALKSW